MQLGADCNTQLALIGRLKEDGSWCIESLSLTITPAELNGSFEKPPDAAPGVAGVVPDTLLIATTPAATEHRGAITEMITGDGNIPIRH
jgi:hypothetical protein